MERKQRESAARSAGLSALVKTELERRFNCKGREGREGEREEKQ